MTTNETIELVGGLIALIAVAVEAIRSGGITLTQVAVAVLGIVFVLLAIL